MPAFIPGLTLNDYFYQEAVQPLIAAHFPDLIYSAALVGTGSEILGFDTAMSTDHGWGPRLMLFLRQSDYEQQHTALYETLRQHLPATFRGYPVGFQVSTAPGDNGTMLLDDTPEDGQPVNHLVKVFSIETFFNDYLNVPNVHHMRPVDWLTCSEQALLELTKGAVYYDGLDIQAIRDKLTYYPDDVWRYQMAAVWTRIGQEEHLAPRAGYVGDNIGSWIIASRLVRDIMRLCFLMKRQYVPYPKWFGTGFQRLDCAEKLSPLLEQVLAGETWQKRETALCAAYEIIANMHNTLSITPPLDSRSQQFHERPFNVLHAWRFADALIATITDDIVKAIAEKTRIGGIDIFSDNTDFLEDTRLHLHLQALYVD
ncbi:MAG: DUF4037 domain-containing protein [Aggregatilineales bacterium]